MALPANVLVNIDTRLVEKTRRFLFEATPSPGGRREIRSDPVISGNDVQVLFRRLDPGVPEPAYAHPGDAGADLVTTVDVTVQPGERAVVPTGVAIALPNGYAAFVHPRSGLAARCGVSVVNAPGTVDAGYRGELQVILVNLDPRTPVELRRGDRIAQLVVQRVEYARFVEVDTLPGSARGANGFGSTGGFAPAESTGTPSAVAGQEERASS